jgi:hypothetical protein
VDAVGLTVVEPVADVDVKVPGEIATVVASVVAQLSVLLAPELMPVGFAVKDVIVGLASAAMATVALAVAEPAALVAVRV